MADPNVRPIKSRYNELYPMHACSVCQLEHVRIPHVKKDGATFVPFEVLQVVEGTARPGAKSPLDTPAHVYGLFWGLPNDRPRFYDILYAN